jgi:hypothetical protein
VEAEEVTSYTDLWVLRCNVDGMAAFAADSGFVVENSAVQWRMVFDHSVHPLAPAIVATSTLAGAPVGFTVNPGDSHEHPVLANAQWRERNTGTLEVCAPPRCESVSRPSPA